MNVHDHITIDQQQLAQLCQRHHIRKLALFGSVLRTDFDQDSDIDVLVEFESGHAVGFIALATIELELSAMFDRRVDLRTPADLSRYFRQDVLQNALVQYAA